MSVLSKFFKPKLKVNRILEIIEKKEMQPKKTGSLWDWQDGYPEAQWELLCRLKNGKFKENENEIVFYTSRNEEIGLTKDFLTEKTKTKKIFGAPGTERIVKSLKDKGVFEITDCVGHYIKVRVEEMFEEKIEPDEDYKCVRLDGQKLALLYIALSKGLFSRPKKGQVYSQSNHDGTCTIWFEREYYASLTESILKAYYYGRFAQSNAEEDWNKLRFEISKAETTVVEDIESLDLYPVYD